MMSKIHNDPYERDGFGRLLAVVAIIVIVSIIGTFL